VGLSTVVIIVQLASGFTIASVQHILLHSQHF